MTVCTTASSKRPSKRAASYLPVNHTLIVQMLVGLDLSVVLVGSHVQAVATNTVVG